MIVTREAGSDDAVRRGLDTADVGDAIEQGKTVIFCHPRHVTVWRPGCRKLWHVVRPIETGEQRVLGGEDGYIAELRAFADELERLERSEL
jgi:hypothetical protein